MLLFFSNLINSKLISELVSSDNTVFLCMQYNTVMTNSDKHYRSLVAQW